MTYSKTIQTYIRIFIALGLAIFILTLWSLISPQRTHASTTADYCVQTWDLEFLKLINDYRSSIGAPQLTQSWTLAAAAQHHSIDMAVTRNYSHTLSDGTTWLDNIIKHGYPFSYRSENIAWGYMTPQQVFNAWKASSGHDTTMRNTGFRAIGISRTLSSSGYPSWVTTFGGTADAQPPLCDSTATPTVVVATPTGSPVTPTNTPTRTPTPTLPVSSDSTPPTTSITSPSNGATVVRKSKVTITASASDNVGVSRVEFLIDGGLKCSDSIPPYTCLWSVGNRPNSAYSLTSRAFDTSNNSAVSSTVRVTSR